MFGVPPAILPLLTKLGEYAKLAIIRAATDAANGLKPDPDKLAEYLEKEMADWNPTVKGRSLADPETRKAAARFLAGVACNLT